MICNLYIFDRCGTCIFYSEWHRPVSTLRDLPDEDRKLMFGLLFSLKQLMNKANPMPCVIVCLLSLWHPLLALPEGFLIGIWQALFFFCALMLLQRGTVFFPL